MPFYLIPLPTNLPDEPEEWCPVCNGHGIENHILVRITGCPEIICEACEGTGFPIEREHENTNTVPVPSGRCKSLP